MGTTVSTIKGTSFLEGLAMNILILWNDLFVKMTENNFVGFIFTLHQYVVMVRWWWLVQFYSNFVPIGHTVEILCVVLQVSET